MKKKLKSLQDKKLNANDMISLKGGKKRQEPATTMVMTNCGGGQTADDGSTDDSDWATGSDL